MSTAVTYPSFPLGIEALHWDLSMNWETGTPYLPHALGAYGNPAGIGVDDVDDRRRVDAFAASEFAGALRRVHGDETSPALSYTLGQGDVPTMRFPAGSSIWLPSPSHAFSLVVMTRAQGQVQFEIVSTAGNAMRLGAVLMLANKHTVADWLGMHGASLSEILFSLASDTFPGKTMYESHDSAKAMSLRSTDDGAKVGMVRYGNDPILSWIIDSTNDLSLRLGPKTLPLLRFLATGEKPLPRIDT